MSRTGLLDDISHIAREAGDVIMQVYESEDFGVETKADSSPLTRADRAASELIVRRLTEVSEYPVVSEENSVRTADGPFWLVDPLDGTKEFVKRGGDFTVNIALVVDGNPVLGVVYAPVLDVLYAGDVEAGESYKETDEGRSVIVAEADTENIVVVASKSHRNAETEEFLARLKNHTAQSIGSSLKLCLVAEGAAMLYPRLGPTCLWDTAAADAVVRAAGGSVCDLEGNELSYQLSDTMLNPFFVAAAKNNILSWQEGK